MRVSREQWDVELCPERDGDFHDPEPVSFRDWYTPEVMEVVVRCRCCGVKGLAHLDLNLGKVAPLDDEGTPKTWISDNELLYLRLRLVEFLQLRKKRKKFNAAVHSLYEVSQDDYAAMRFLVAELFDYEEIGSQIMSDQTYLGHFQGLPVFLAPNEG